MMTQTSQPMSVNITIHAAQGMDERAIAQQVAKEIQRIENQRQARARSSMWTEHNKRAKALFCCLL